MNYFLSRKWNLYVLKNKKKILFYTLCQKILSFFVENETNFNPLCTNYLLFKKEIIKLKCKMDQRERNLQIKIYIITKWKIAIFFNFFSNKK